MNKAPEQSWEEFNRAYLLEAGTITPTRPTVAT